MSLLLVFLFVSGVGGFANWVRAGCDERVSDYSHAEETRELWEDGDCFDPCAEVGDLESV